MYSKNCADKNFNDINNFLSPYNLKTIYVGVQSSNETHGPRFHHQSAETCLQ